MADVRRIRAVAARVVETRRTGVDVVVVVSAMGNTTSELLALAREVSDNPGRRELDLLISVGERVSMTLLAMAIQDLGEPAQSFTGSQSGIITDTHHVAARVLDVKPHRIQRALDEGQIAIVAGFQGVSKTGEVTTLGRGGSDTTAVVLTAALGAEYCEICSDVDGVYTADPRSVPDAERMDDVSLDAAIEMAEAGSKILLAEALAQAKTHGVTLMAGATSKPSGTGTRVHPEAIDEAVVGVACDDKLFVAERGADLSTAAGAIRARLPDGRAIIDSRNLPDASTWGFPAEPIATVSVIGCAVVSDPEVMCAAEAAVEASTTHAVTWAQGNRFTAMVARSEAPQVERALHTALVASRSILGQDCP